MPYQSMVQKKIEDLNRYKPELRHIHDEKVSISMFYCHQCVIDH